MAERRRKVVSVEHTSEKVAPDVRPVPPAGPQAPSPPAGPQAPGWWQASNGGWYPPEARPGPPTAPESAPNQAQMRNGMGTAAFVVGLIGLLIAIIPFLGIAAFPLAVLAIVFGMIGAFRADRGEANNRGMAMAGLVLGILAFLWIILVLSVVTGR